MVPFASQTSKGSSEYQRVAALDYLDMLGGLIRER
jgi:hypothetical protein